jgi:methylmalonyl-CoA mutase
MNLFTEFSESSQEEWEQKIIHDLKGKPLDSIVWNSDVGKINPVLFETTIEQANPNEFPYTRGVKAINNAWDIRQQFEGEQEQLNKSILEALEGGVNAIEILKLETPDFKVIFKNVQLDIIKVYLHVNSHSAKQIGEKLVEYCNENNYQLESIVGGLIFDPINELSLTGNLKFDESVVDYLIGFNQQFPNMNTFGVNGSVYAEAGAKIDTQIACALSHGHEYLVQRLSSGESLKQITDSIEFSLAIGTSYFMEIAKIRAFRTLWSTIVNEYDEELFDFNIKITAQTANINYSLADKYNNLLRATTGAMSAVIAGVDSLTVVPFDNNEVKESASFGFRLAKNIQLLMQEEAFLNQVIDPAGGSYYIEELTNKIQESAWSQFNEIEEQGGIMQGMIQGDIQELIRKQYQVKESAVLEGSKVMVGVNKFEDEAGFSGVEVPELKVKENIVDVLEMKRLSSVKEIK